MRGYASLCKALMRGYLRDRTLIFFTIAFPLLFMVVFASLYGSTDDNQPRLLTVGEVSLLEQSAGSDFEIEEIDDLDQAQAQLADGEADAAITQSGSDITIYYSQANPIASQAAVGGVESVIGETNIARLSAEAPDVEVIFADLVSVEDETLSPIQFLTPGLLAWAIAISGVFGAAGTIVDWKQTKLLRRLRLTPAPVQSVISARISVSLVVALIQMAIFLGLAVSVFGMTLEGWWWTAVPLVLLGCVSFLSIGVVVGSLAQSSAGAAGLSNLIVMPLAFASGAFFPLSQSPEWLQTVSMVSPMRYLNTGMQKVMVQGESPLAMWPEVLALLIATTVMIGLAWKLFKWEEV